LDALAISAVFGLGVVFVFDALTRPRDAKDLRSSFRAIGPRIIAGAGGAAIAMVATGWPVAGLGGGIVGWAIPEALARSQAERVALERREGIAEVAARLRDAIRSGIGISDALMQSAERAPWAIREELRRLVAEARVSGLAEAAEAFAGRTRDPSAQLFASALSTADRLGSRNLSDVLEALAEATMAEATTIREARARQIRNRMSARIVAAMPILLLVAIRRANPEYLEPFAEPAGQTVLAFAFGLIWVGYAAMRRAARLERSGS
jgi:tight adherence protein B